MDTWFIFVESGTHYCLSLCLPLTSCSGQKLGYGQITSFTAALENPQQVINGYVFCDEIGEKKRF